MIEIKEVLYRYQKGNSIKKITRSLGLARNTVRNFIRRAQAIGFKPHESSSPSLEEISNQVVTAKERKSTNKGDIQALLSKHHEQLSLWRSHPHMTATQMVRLLQESLDLKVSERSMRRYVARHLKIQEKPSTVHLESLPGKEAQVDFGYVGFMQDPLAGKIKKAYAFIMTLSYSRYPFVRFVFRQDSQTWIDCHKRAFQFFGGVPETILLDNLKAGVTHPDLYDPTLNRLYSELEQHYGFVADPAKVRTPEHKGKVERRVTIVRQQLIAGRDYKSIEEANHRALQWCRYEISQRLTRTTGQTPWALFTHHEKSVLKPLPDTEYECPVWQEAKVHRDQHVVFEGSFYSVPLSYLDKQVWIKATQRVVEIFYQEKLIKTHCRSQQKGTWVTDKQDYPEHSRAFLEFNKEDCLKEALAIGSYVHDLLKDILSIPGKTSQRKAQAILRLKQEFEGAKLNTACQRCLTFGNTDYKSLKRILTQGIESLPSVTEESRSRPSPASAFLRNPREFMATHQEACL